MMSSSVLITGGAGYIGSHTCVALAREGYRPVILDTFANASQQIVSRLNDLCGQEIPLHRVDIRDEAGLTRLFKDTAFGAVIHCAALKSIAESKRNPERYNDINVTGSQTLIRAAHRAGIHRILFSSSASVYGTPASVPVTEAHSANAENPYGLSKLAIERMLHAKGQSDPQWQAGVFRYFNAAGADPSGRIGENPQGEPGNLFPVVAQAALGQRDAVTIFGDEFPTRDGTGERDFVHVLDIADAHVAALRHFERGGKGFTVNLGTGTPHSVREVVETFERISGRTIRAVVTGARDGDVATSFADPALAKDILGWTAQRDLQAICRDAWAWYSRHPHGYDAPAGANA